jgi:hypothetical protein
MAKQLLIIECNCGIKPEFVWPRLDLTLGLFRSIEESTRVKSGNSLSRCRSRYAGAWREICAPGDLLRHCALATVLDGGKIVHRATYCAIARWPQYWMEGKLCTGRPTAPIITRYRCFLPDLAGLAGLRRVGPGTGTILPLQTFLRSQPNQHPHKPIPASQSQPQRKPHRQGSFRIDRHDKFMTQLR